MKKLLAVFIVIAFLMSVGLAFLLMRPAFALREYELDYTPWKSATEIKMWVESTGISERTYIIDVYDCDDMAVDLFFIALDDKRLVGLYQWEYKNRQHTLNFTVYGNRIYVIDPFTCKVWDTCWIDSYPPSWKIIPKRGN